MIVCVVVCAVVFNMLVCVIVLVLYVIVLMMATSIMPMFVQTPVATFRVSSTELPERNVFDPT